MLFAKRIGVACRETSIWITARSWADPDPLQHPIEDQRGIAFVDPELSCRESAFLRNANKG
jgi:hypothetical protein